MPRAAYRTDLGVGWVHYDQRGLVSITLPAGGEPDPLPHDVPPRVARLVDALEAYYAGRASLVVPPDLIDAAGRTPLLHEIYRIVSAIKPGHTMTYGEVAVAAAGHRSAARAVGAAMASNPFAPVIPCHRVVGSDGRLHGYGGGLHQKEALLRMEHAAAPDGGGDRGRRQFELEGVGGG